MTVKIGINGFGRIGRTVFRLLQERGVEVVGINDITDPEALAYLLRHDTVFGNYPGKAVIDGDKHDLRHLDPKGGYIVGLTPKGAKAKKDLSAFTVTDEVEPAWLAA